MWLILLLGFLVFMYCDVLCGKGMILFLGDLKFDLDFIFIFGEDNLFIVFFFGNIIFIYNNVYIFLKFFIGYWF